MAPLTPSANWAKPPPVSPSCPHSQGSRPPGTWKSSVAIGWSSLQAPETELCPNRLLTFKSVFLKHTYYNVISCCTPINSSLWLLPMKNGLHDLPPILLSAALLLSLLQAGVTTGNHAICILLKLSKLSQSVQTNKQLWSGPTCVTPTCIPNLRNHLVCLQGRIQIPPLAWTFHQPHSSPVRTDASCLCVPPGLFPVLFFFLHSCSNSLVHTICMFSHLLDKQIEQ